MKSRVDMVFGVINNSLIKRSLSEMPNISVYSLGLHPEENNE